MLSTLSPFDIVLLSLLSLVIIEVIVIAYFKTHFVKQWDEKEQRFIFTQRRNQPER